MKATLNIFLLFLIGALKSQIIFSPAQAEWNYKVTSLVSPAIYSEKINYVRDTICSGQNAKVLIHTKSVNQCGASFNGLTVIRSSNDSVYFRSPLTFHNWELLYAYNATVGQSWKINIKNGDLSVNTITVTVDSINYKTINSTSLKYLKVKYKMPRLTDTIIYSGTITERFGDEAFMFNFSIKESSSCGTWYINPILCYQDSSFALKQFTLLPCNYTNVFIHEIQEIKSDIQIYPNPTSGSFYVQSTEYSNLEIVNELGLIIKRVNLNESNSMKCYISNLPAGVYFLREMDTRKFINRKIIILN